MNFKKIADTSFKEIENISWSSHQTWRTKFSKWMFKIWKRVGPNEVQLSDMTNQFFQMIIQDSWKKECLAIFTEKQRRI